MNIESVNQLRWSKGHIVPFWNKSDYVDLPYVKQGITEEEVNIWVNDGYPKDLSFTGMMYDNKNTMPTFINKLKEYFVSSYENLTFTFYKMESMDIMPNHIDHFRTYCKLFDVNRDNVVRILVMLEDWKPGHYLEINSKAITNWVAGDYFIWENDVPHAASNIGKKVDTRYTLQITATKKQLDDQEHDFYTFNLGSKYDSTKIGDEYVVQRIQKVLSNNNGNPYHIKLSNGRIFTLEKVKYTQDEIDKLNATGVDIYLYEPLSYFNKDIANFYGSSHHHSERFYSEFDSNVKPEQIRADELDSILIYKKNNNLSKVRVHLCDAYTEHWLTHYNNDLELLYDDIFVKTIHDRKIVNQTFEPPIFKKKFINLNYRYTFHRHLTAAYMSQTNSCHLSWYFKCDYEYAKYSMWYNLDKLSETEPEFYKKLVNGITNLNNNSPFNIDFAIEEPTVIEHIYYKDIFPKKKNITNISFLSIENYYKETFCDVITETRYAQPTPNYSEKVFQPMFYRRPFILVGPPKTLRLLQQQGFKTFHDFWDESYDYTDCHEKRMLAIFKLVDTINNMSMDECHKLYEEMKSVIEHNYHLAKASIHPDLK